MKLGRYGIIFRNVKPFWILPYSLFEMFKPSKYLKHCTAEFCEEFVDYIKLCIFAILVTPLLMIASLIGHVVRFFPEKEVENNGRCSN